MAAHDYERVCEGVDRPSTCVFFRGLVVGRWLDLYLMVLPPLVGDEPTFGLYEVRPFAGAVAFFVLVVFRSLGRSNIIPLGDPMLEESLDHHQ